jgi:hypothetical protein
MHEDFADDDDDVDLEDDRRKLPTIAARATVREWMGGTVLRLNKSTKK